MRLKSKGLLAASEVIRRKSCLRTVTVPGGGVSPFPRAIKNITSGTSDSCIVILFRRLVSLPIALPGPLLVAASRMVNQFDMVAHRLTSAVRIL